MGSTCCVGEKLGCLRVQEPAVEWFLVFPGGKLLEAGALGSSDKSNVLTGAEVVLLCCI